MRRVLGALGGLALVAALVVLWPARLGGSVTYVVTHGTSMQPSFHTGDLAIIRTAGSYDVGDVVAYRSDSLHTTVLHRIIGRDGDRYLFKGDHNSWVDPEHPGRDQLLGKLWLHLPKVGAVLRWLATPLHAALLVIALLLLAGGEQQRRRRRRSTPTFDRARWAVPVRHVPAVAAGLAATAVLSAALSVVVFARPTTTTATRTVDYHAATTVGYHADAARSVAYPHGEVAAGEPIYRRLVRTVDVTATSRLAADAAVTASGTARMDAVVSLPDGWHRTVAMAPPEPFTGMQATVTGTLSLRDLSALMQRMGTLTGAPATDFVVTVRSIVSYDARVAGRAVAATDTGQLVLRVDQLRVTAVSQPGGTQPAPAGTTGSVQVPVQQPAIIPVLRWRVPTGTARMLMAALTALLALAAAICWARSRRGVNDTRGVLQALPSGRIVTVAEAPVTAGPVVDLAAPDALARVARDYQRLVLHHEATATFYVEDMGTLYRFRAGPVAIRPPGSVPPVSAPLAAASPADASTAPAPVPAAIPWPRPAAAPSRGGRHR